MENIGAFDVIGPVMVGPSSSHTAGALRIAALARKVAGAPAARAEFTLYGSFARTYRGHGTDRALVAGMLGFGPGDTRIRDSFALAERAGLAFAFAFDTANPDGHPNTVDIAMTLADGRVVRVTGVSTGGGAAEIRRIDGVDLALTGEYPTVLVKQRDEPGVAAHITRCLAEAGVNIANMSLHREGRGRTAYTVVETDQFVRPEAVAEIRRHPSIVAALLIE